MRSKISAKTLDPAATRAAILASATRLFSAKGMSATSTAEIAAEAGVTKSLVPYHFASKEDLWRAVLLAKSGPFFEATAAFLSDHPASDVRQIAKAKFERLRSDTELARLMAWMSLEESFAAPEMTERLQRVRAKIEADPASVGIPAGLDPQMFMVLVMSSIDGYYRFRKMYSLMLGVTLACPQAEDEFLDVMMRTLFNKAAEGQVAV